MKLRLAVLALAVGLGPIVAACGTSSDSLPGTGAITGAAGQSGAGQAGAGAGATASGGSPAACSNVTPCGGDVVGTWSVASSCLKVTGELNLSLFNAGCPSAPVTGSLQVSGTWTAHPDGTYSDDTTTTGEEQIILAQSCLVISSAPVTCDGAASLLTSIGYSKLTCIDAPGGGCTCSGDVHQTGGLGLVSPIASANGNYATSGNLLTLTDLGDTKYPYCVSGNQMTWTPQSETPTLTGSVVLQKVNGGSGGAAGSGGDGAAGGNVATGGTGGLPAAGGSAGSGGSGGSVGAIGPCDIYLAGGNPCVAAHSTVRALFGSYNGKLYQVRNSAGATKDILTLGPGGVADGASQDTFCTGTVCVITVVYDQSGKGNDLWYQGSTQVPASTQSSPSKATTESLTLGGHKVYSLYINPGNSYWVDASKSGIPLGSEPEGMYMVTNGKHYNAGCCFDYGNSETDRKADGAGAMDAINLSSTTAWGTGAGAGPWVMADLEYGLFTQGNSGKNPSSPSQTATFVTALLKNNGKTEYALRGSDATAGSPTTYYKGALPGGWSPMKKQGAIVLGSGGDCCKPGGGANQSVGTFYEGSIVSGYPSDATENAVQANIVSAGYSK